MNTKDCTLSSDPLRILAVSATWQGANDYAFVRAFRRAGHSVRVVSEDNFIPSGWKNNALRGFRRLARPMLVREFNRVLLNEAEKLEPDLLFVFKGAFVLPNTINSIKNLGCKAINFYPDVSFMVHGPYIPHSLPNYDWVFTTKSFGLSDMKEQLGVTNASFLPHGYDPETHKQALLSDRDLLKYGCDVSFIATSSPKKQKITENIRQAIPSIKFKIWGPENWKNWSSKNPGVYMDEAVYGSEYAKAISASKINLSILSESRFGSSSGDRITSRTFHIPASGGFMLHERNEESTKYFKEGVECEFFSSEEELIDKIKYYLSNDELRVKIARAGFDRCIKSKYSIENNSELIIKKYNDLKIQ